MLFNFLCSAVLSVTTVNNIHGMIPEGAEQRDPSDGSKSTDELLRNVRLPETPSAEGYGHRQNDLPGEEGRCESQRHAAKCKYLPEYIQEIMRKQEE